MSLNIQQTLICKWIGGAIHVKDFMGEDEEEHQKNDEINEEEFKKKQAAFDIQQAVNEFISYIPDELKHENAYFII